MYKYVNPNSIQEDGKCLQVGEGTNTEKYKAFGMVKKDVEKSEIDNCWYLKAKCPHYTDEEKEQQEQTKRDEEAQAELQETIAAIKADMISALLSDDTEWQEELKEEYNAVLNGEE